MIKHIEPVDEIKLKKALESGDYSTAKKLIGSFLDQKLSQEERGQIYAQIVSTYLTLTNDVNKSYLEELTKANEDLKKLRVSEKKSGTAMRIAEIKQNLAE